MRHKPTLHPVYKEWRLLISLALVLIGVCSSGCPTYAFRTSA